jgi:hypothetical protein
MPFSALALRRPPHTDEPQSDLSCGSRVGQQRIDWLINALADGSLPADRSGNAGAFEPVFELRPRFRSASPKHAAPFLSRVDLWGPRPHVGLVQAAARHRAVIGSRSPRGPDLQGRSTDGPAACADLPRRGRTATLSGQRRSNVTLDSDSDVEFETMTSLQKFADKTFRGDMRVRKRCARRSSEARGEVRLGGTC